MGRSRVSGKHSKRRFLKANSESIRPKRGWTFLEERADDTKERRGHNMVSGEFQTVVTLLSLECLWGQKEIK